MALQYRPECSESTAENMVAGASSPARAGPLGPSGFALLPYELRTPIVQLACRLPSTSSSVSSSASNTVTGLSTHSALPGLDVPTTLSLARTSRSLYAQVTPLIFSHAWINRPSALVSFHQALIARPELGRLVRSLHVGPDDEIPQWWYPLAQKGRRPTSWDWDRGRAPRPLTSITTTLRAETEAVLLPRGCTPRQLWDLEHQEIDCRSEAIRRALFVAEKAIDVDFGQRANFGDVVWVEKLFEAHAAFELYLFKMREVEEEEEQRLVEQPKDVKDQEHSKWSDHSNCNRYPAFTVEGYPASRPSRDASAESNPGSPASSDGSSTYPKQTYIVSRADILRHLARPGSITDRFNHPLLFARSGLVTVNRARRGGQVRTIEVRPVEDSVDFADLFSSEAASSTTVSRVLDPSLPDPPTLGSILAQLRSVLSYTPYLDTLSLTGFLERAVCGTRSAAPLLKSLRALSLGPPPLKWSRPMQFEDLHRVEKLRICGVMLRQDEASSIAKDLKSLKEMQWRLPSEARDRDCLLNSINILVGRHNPPATPAGDDDDPDYDAREFDAISNFDELYWLDGDLPYCPPLVAADAYQEGSLLLEVKLHPIDYDFLLNEAPSDAVKRAWSSGRAWNGARGRLLLVDNPGAGPDRYGSSAADSMADAWYREGREWWEEKAGVSSGRKEL